tara:strand:+ start:1582 stop:1818 length:237 start_codon:yes stop_codon:yes gene_type:complete
MSVARGTPQQVVATQKQMLDEQADIEARIFDTVLVSEGAVSVSEAYQMTNAQMAHFVKRLGNLKEKEAAARKAASKAR